MVDPHHSTEAHVGEVINSQALRNLFRRMEEELLESSDMLWREHFINRMRARMFARDGVLHMTMTGPELLMAREFERTVALGIAERMIINLIQRLAWDCAKDNCVSELQAVQAGDDFVHRVIDSSVERVREAHADSPLFMAAEHWSVQLVEAALGPDPDV